MNSNYDFLKQQGSNSRERWRPSAVPVPWVASCTPVGGRSKEKVCGEGGRGASFSSRSFFLSCLWDSLGCLGSPR